MTGEELLEKMTFVDVKLIEAADVRPKRKERRWIKWAAAAACFMCVLAAGSWVRQNLLPEKGSASEPHPGDYNCNADYNGYVSEGEKAGGSPEAVEKSQIIINEVDGAYWSEEDMDVRFLYDGLPQAFEDSIGIGYESFLKRVPDIFLLDSFYGLASRGFQDGAPDSEYTLHDFVLDYTTETGGKARITLCGFEEPLRDCIFTCEDPAESRVNGRTLILYGAGDSVMTRFSNQGIFYDIEATGLTVEELELLLAGLILE